jgi:hypothetical protein
MLNMKANKPHKHHERCNIDANHRHAPFVTNKMQASIEKNETFFNNL